MCQGTAVLGRNTVSVLQPSESVSPALFTYCRSYIFRAEKGMAHQESEKQCFHILLNILGWLAIQHQCFPHCSGEASSYSILETVPLTCFCYYNHS